VKPHPPPFVFVVVHPPVEVRAGMTSEVVPAHVLRTLVAGAPRVTVVFPKFDSL
jgi:hypothetical protein